MFASLLCSPPGSLLYFFHKSQIIDFGSLDTFPTSFHNLKHRENVYLTYQNIFKWKVSSSIISFYLYYLDKAGLRNNKTHSRRVFWKTWGHQGRSGSGCLSIPKILTIVSEAPIGAQKLEKGEKGGTPAEKIVKRKEWERGEKNISYCEPGIKCRSGWGPQKRQRAWNGGSRKWFLRGLREVLLGPREALLGPGNALLGPHEALMVLREVPRGPRPVWLLHGAPWGSFRAR